MIEYKYKINKLIKWLKNKYLIKYKIKLEIICKIFKLV